MTGGTGSGGAGDVAFRGVETRSIDYVPDRERHGSVWQQAAFWFTGNFNFFTIAIGFIGPAQGLSFSWTVLASFAGLAFGTLFMALHASQGPDLGLPQLIQSRAQFGFKGVLVALAASLFTFLTFNVIDTMLVSQGLATMAGLDARVTAVVMAIGAVVPAVVGHDWLHRVFRVLFWVSLPAYAILSAALAGGLVATTNPDRGTFVWTALAVQFAVTASYNITFAPYVSDYTRYLPRSSSRPALIAAVYLGASVSSVWLIALGAYLAAFMGASDGLAALLAAGDQLFAGAGVALVALSVAALVAAMSLNAYSGSLTLLTTVDCFRPVKPTLGARISAILALAAVWLTVSNALHDSAVGALYLGLTLMLYVLTPWSAVNLVDYFLVRRRIYAIGQLHDRDGIYGTWNARGLTGYAAGLLAGLPFFSLPGLFTGAAASALGGSDVAWMPELIVSAAVYLALHARVDLTAERSIATREQQALEAETSSPSLR